MNRNFFSLFVVVSFLVVGGLQSTPTPTPTPKPGLKIKSTVVTTPTPTAPPKRIKGAVAGPTSTPIRIDKGTKTGPGPTPIKIGKDQIKAEPSRAPIKVIKTQVSTPTPTVPPIKVIKTQVGTPTPTPSRKIKDQVTSSTTPIRIPKDGATGGGGRPGPINLSGPTPGSKKLTPGQNNLPPAPVRTLGTSSSAPTPGSKKLIPGQNNLPPDPGKNLGTGNSAPPPAPAPSSPTPTLGGGSNMSAGELPVGDRLPPPGDKLPPTFVAPPIVTMQVGAEPHKPGSNMTVGAKVALNNGSPIEGATVSFSLDSAKPLGSAKTYPNGIATVSFQLPWDAAKGSHNIVADVAAGTGYTAGHGSGTFQVADKIVTLKLLLGGKARKGQTIALTASADEDGTALKTGHALFFMEGKYLGSAPFDQSGNSPSLKWSVPLDVSNGSHKLTAKVAAAIAFPPEASKARATAEATLVVEAPVVYFEGPEVTRHHQETARFSGTLYLSRESKTPASNQDVIVTWSGIEGSCSSKTDAQGKFSCDGSLIPWSLAAGSYDVAVTLKSGEKAQGSASLTVAKDKLPAKLKVSSQLFGSAKFPGGSEVSAQLTRETDGAGIDGREVSYTVNGKPVGTATTAGGWARQAFPAPEPRPDALKVDVAFAGDNLYLPATDSLTFPLTPEKTQAYIKMVSAPAGVVGQTLSFQAKLSLTTSPYGSLPGFDFSNQKMRFIFEYIDSWTGKLESFSAEGTTGTDGIATASVKPRATCKSLRVRLESSKWKADDLTISVQIGPANVELVLDPVAGNIGQTVTLQAHATRTSDNAPLSGVEVKFDLVGGQSLGKAKPDASGEATLAVKLTSSMGIGAHEIQITTPKTDDYNAGTGKGTIQIGPSQQ